MWEPPLATLPHRGPTQQPLPIPRPLAKSDETPPFINGYDASGFPRPHRRGRIEAEHVCFIIKETRRFPRPHRRGRIEASLYLELGKKAASVFHGLTAVAELKLFAFDKGPGLREVFHGLTAVA